MQLQIASYFVEVSTRPHFSARLGQAETDRSTFLELPCGCSQTSCSITFCKGAVYLRGRRSSSRESFWSHRISIAAEGRFCHPPCGAPWMGVILPDTPSYHSETMDRPTPRSVAMRGVNRK